MTGTHTVAPGDLLKVVTQSSSASVFLARVSGDDVRIAVDRSYASDGVLLESGDVANVAVPGGEELVAYGAGDADSTLTLDLLDSNYQGEQLTISLQPRSIVDIEGNVQSDVVDEAGRELGKVRVQDSGGVLVNPAQQSDVEGVENALGDVHPRTIEAWNAGALEAQPPDSARIVTQTDDFQAVHEPGYRTTHTLLISGGSEGDEWQVSANPESGNSFFGDVVLETVTVGASGDASATFRASADELSVSSVSGGTLDWYAISSSP